MSNTMTGHTPDSVQLDLFVHSRAVILANDTINALLARDAAQASACLGRLGAELPDYGALNALEILSRALSEWPLRSTSPPEIAVAVGRIEGEVHPAALAAMGAKAADFMRPFWHDLAHAARLHAYDAAFPQSFCAGLYLRCGDVRAAARTAESIPDWKRNADALHWLAVASYRIGGLDTCLAPLIRLALRAPQRLSTALAEIDDPLLNRDWSAFQLTCDWLDPDDETADAWFSAWYLVEHPGVRVGADDATSLPATQAAQTFLAIASLLELEKRGLSAALISSRGQLRDLDPEMFAFYMARRDVDHR
jgi:hypothetical protein